MRQQAIRRCIITGLLLLLACQTFAQKAETDAQKAASYFREADSAARYQQLWSQPLYGPTLLVDPQSRHTYANRPDSAGNFKQALPGVYEGILPREVMIANTAVRWQGRLWSLIMWPLPGNRDSRVKLLMHESFHRVQEALGLPANSPTVDHLATMQGRIYFLLELQALKAALSKPASQRNDELSHALFFREKRHSLFPATFGKERELEMNEGLAEFTGLILGIPKDSIPQHLCQEIDGAAERKSLIRSMAYITGPIYGYLLYEKSPTWTRSVNSASSFPALISEYYHASDVTGLKGNALNNIKQRYGGDSIMRSELAKEEKRLHQVQFYTNLFLQQPVLTVKLVKMNIVFNPNNLFDLGSYGTVYPTAEITDAWGKLTVTDQGLLLKDWQVVTLPAPGEIILKDRTLKGNGWSIILNEHWQLSKIDAKHFTLVHKSDKN